MLKMVRDKYDEIIDSKFLRKAEGSEIEYFTELKIDEELIELKNSNFEDVKEYADVIEVIIRMAELKGISENEISTERKNKNIEKGKFMKNLLYYFDKNWNVT